MSLSVTLMIIVCGESDITYMKKMQNRPKGQKSKKSSII